MRKSKMYTLGHGLAMVSLICMICSPAKGWINDSSNSVSNPGGPLTKVVKSGEFEDFERIEFEGPYGGTYTALLDWEQREYPLMSVFQCTSYVTGVGITQKGYDTQHFIVYEDEYMMVLDLYRYGAYIGELIFDRDPSTDEIMMSIYDDTRSLICSGPLDVTLDAGEKNKRGFWGFVLVAIIIIIEVADIIKERRAVPPPPPNTPVTIGPVFTSNGDVSYQTAWPDGRVVTQTFHPDGSITTTEYDPNKVPSTKTTKTEAPESAQNEPN